ncbi:hypothetical protein E2C01_070268 [Portunus trituberculatus]|uniref:Uncharacterized protein n=1 Tax=Portunus trituberculatus TaxID=210409 RepID=A0A5B7HS90_PORTR|nr:hypothetical protein [Portunus trituberculatus]
MFRLFPVLYTCRPSTLILSCTTRPPFPACHVPFYLHPVTCLVSALSVSPPSSPSSITLFILPLDTCLFSSPRYTCSSPSSNTCWLPLPVSSILLRASLSLSLITPRPGTCNGVLRGKVERRRVPLLGWGLD